VADMRWLNTNLLLVGGVASGVLAGVLAATGIVVFGTDSMMPNLFAELTGVALEVAIVSLVVERLASIHKRHEWDFAYQSLPKYATQTFVDIMRLLYLPGSPQDNAMPERYQYFILRANRHLRDLQSNIEVSGIALDPGTYNTSRQIERRLAWCLDHLQDPLYLDSFDSVMETMSETAPLVLSLLQVKGQHNEKLAQATNSVKAIGGGSLEDRLRADFLATRLDAQSNYLESLPNGRGLSIARDIDNDLSIDYFLIDYILLQKMLAARS
jgi:hypothetical protein